MGIKGPVKELKTDMLFDQVIFWLQRCVAEAEPNQRMSKKEFLIFSSDIFIECILEQPRAPLRPCQSYLRKSEWGVLGACRGSLGPDWFNFLLPGRKQRTQKHREREKNEER